MDSYEKGINKKAVRKIKFLYRKIKNQ